MSDGDDPGTESEKRGTDLGPETRDFEAELAERRRERFGATAADVDDDESEELLEPPESEAVEVDSETARAFWAAVVYVNVGLFLLVLGPLLAHFRGRRLVGTIAVAGATFAIYRAWTVYRGFKARETGGESSADANDDGNGTSE